MSTLAQPLLSVRTQHKFRKIRWFYKKKCGSLYLKNPLPFVHKLSALDKPLSLLSVDVFYGQPLFNI